MYTTYEEQISFNPSQRFCRGNLQSSPYTVFCVHWHSLGTWQRRNRGWDLVTAYTVNVSRFVAILCHRKYVLLCTINKYCPAMQPQNWSCCFAGCVLSKHPSFFYIFLNTLVFVLRKLLMVVHYNCSILLYEVMLFSWIIPVQWLIYRNGQQILNISVMARDRVFLTKCWSPCKTHKGLYPYQWP